MDNKKNFFVIIGSLSIVLIITLVSYLIFDDILSIIEMRKEITFSWRSIAILSVFPLCFYMFSCVFYYSVTLKPMKLNANLVKILTITFFVFLFLSFPFSWYLDSKLREEGYVVCQRLSVGSPNKYVKDPNLCR